MSWHHRWRRSGAATLPASPDRGPDSARCHVHAVEQCPQERARDEHGGSLVGVSPAWSVLLPSRRRAHEQQGASLRVTILVSLCSGRAHIALAGRPSSSAEPCQATGPLGTPQAVTSPGRAVVLPGVGLCASSGRRDGTRPGPRRVARDPGNLTIKAASAACGRVGGGWGLFGTVGMLAWEG